MKGSLLGPETIVVCTELRPPVVQTLPLCDTIDEPADPIPDVTDEREDRFDTELGEDDDGTADIEADDDDGDDDADEWLLLLLGL